jgi:hypothetical protein
LLIKAFRDTIAIAGLDTPNANRTEDIGRTSAGPKGDAAMSLAAAVAVQSPGRGLYQRTFTTGNDDIDASITIVSRSGGVTSEDIAFLKDYLDFLEKSWSRRKPTGGQNQPIVASDSDSMVE